MKNNCKDCHSCDEPCGRQEGVCKVPLCTNHIQNNLPFCIDCLRNTVRRFMHLEGSKLLTDDTPPTEKQKERAIHWTNYIIQNWEGLVAEEEKAILFTRLVYEGTASE